MSSIELAAGSRVFAQDGRGIEACPMLALQPFEGFEDGGGSQLVDGAEGSAPPGRETKAEDRAHIAVHGLAKNALLQAVGGLIQEGVEQPFLNHLGVH